MEQRRGGGHGRAGGLALCRCTDSTPPFSSSLSRVPRLSRLTPPQSPFRLVIHHPVAIAWCGVCGIDGVRARVVDAKVRASQSPVAKGAGVRRCTADWTGDGRLVITSHLPPPCPLALAPPSPRCVQRLDCSRRRTRRYRYAARAVLRCVSRVACSVCSRRER
ncbi:hypothetical protein C8R47DRAFT_1091480 [Mycena vitilis]|nr:hypothetical protein C8R47DRAFT_1091480 [Mycena vitilis]